MTVFERIAIVEKAKNKNKKGGATKTKNTATKRITASNRTRRNGQKIRLKNQNKNIGKEKKTKSTRPQTFYKRVCPSVRSSVCPSVRLHASSKTVDHANSDGWNHSGTLLGVVLLETNAANILSSDHQP